MIPVTVKLTPDDSFKQGQKADVLLGWMQKNKKTLLDGSFVLPEKIDDLPLLGASAPTTGGFPDRWFLDIPNPLEETTEQQWQKIRKNLSINTCSGCHGAEPGHDLNRGTLFLHITNRSVGQVARLSDFLRKDLEVRKKLMKEDLGCKVADGLSLTSPEDSKKLRANRSSRTH